MMKLKRFTVGGLALLLCFVVAGVSSQENAVKNLSPSLIECYKDDTYEKWKLLPHNMETLIAIVRKIEDSPGLNMDLRQLSSAILHRFRQDGIVKNPQVKPQVGIMPYAPLGKQFFRHAQTLRVIPGNAVTFPNNSISALERCTLHSMLSSSIDIFERGDESRVCKFANYAYRRYSRSAAEHHERNVKEEVETLTAEQIEMMSKGDAVEPSSLYPALPPNHPGSAKLTDLPPYSRCPTENGVVKTAWGTVSAGSVLAGIAAGLTPQRIRIGDLIRQTEQRVTSYSNDASVSNKFLGTLAGDLAEVALLQGPQLSERYILGVDGNWNSSTQPLYYFLSGNENLQMTAAEVRGDYDGLILSERVPEYYPSKVAGLKLSQVLDMYYSNRGLFDRANRACYRRAHLPSVVPTEMLVTQTHNAAIVLSSGIATATFSSEAIKKFATQAVKDLSTLVPTMNNDASCEFSQSANDLADVSQPAVDLTVILDTTWPFDNIKSILSQLLDGLDICKYNSNVTIVNGQDGSFILNSSNNIIDFHRYFNSSNYEKIYNKGFELSRSLERLRLLQTYKLNEERRVGWAGGKSDVVLFVPYRSNSPQSDKEYCLSTIKTMQEEVPDAVLLFLTYGSKDAWSEYVRDPNNDLFSVSIGETTQSYPSVGTLQTRIKQIPRRLINTKCGADYDESNGSTKPLMESVSPGAVNYYRIHPNYYYTDNTDNPPRIRIQGTSTGSLRVCTSLELLHVNVSEAAATTSCVSITSNTHTVPIKCENANYVHQCKPYYLSVGFNSTGPSTFGCNDEKICRYPDNARYTISFENLVCKSGAGTLSVAPLFLLLVLAQLF